MDMKKSVKKSAKKSWVIVILFILAMSTLTGCKKDKGTVGEKAIKTDEGTKADEGTKTEEVSKGRYIEEEILLPEGESAIQLLQSQDGQMELYTRVDDGTNYKKYVLNEDAKWEERKQSWINAIFDKFLEKDNFDGNIDRIVLGENGVYYALVNAYGQKESRKYIFCSTDGETDCSKVNIPFLEEKMGNDADYVQRKWVSDIQVLKNGNIVLNDAGERKLLTFSKEGELLFESQIEGQNGSEGRWNHISVSENTIIGIKNDAAEIQFVNGETGKEERNVEISQQETGAIVCALSNGITILVDKKGIHRLIEDGTLWETVADGELNTMGMPTANLMNFYVEEGEIETYYALYSDGDGKPTMIHYFFDKTIPSVPEKELTVYSLKDNATIRQGIALFQRKHQDVKVKYVVAMKEGEGDTQEYIRALNTEIIAGNGADVLVLDGLSASSYAQNGVLKDISGICAEAGLLPNVLEAYTVDEKIYQIPTKIRVPIVVGTKEVVESARDLTSIVDYAKKNHDKPFVRDVGYTKVAEEFIKMEYTSLIRADNTLDTEAFKEYLENLSYLNEKGCFTTNPDFENIFDSNPFFLKENITSAEWECIPEIMSLFNAEALITNTKNEMGSLADAFYSAGLLGINQATKKTELAEEFISFVLSTEVQKVGVYDGLPVGEEAWNIMLDEENDGMTWKMSYKMEDGTVAYLDGSYPKREIRDAFYEIARSTTNPILLEDPIVKLMLTEMKGFLSGSIDIPRTVQAVESKINRYLSEQEVW